MYFMLRLSASKVTPYLQPDKATDENEIAAKIIPGRYFHYKINSFIFAARFQKHKVKMGATSLKRKARKNRVVSKRRQQAIKLNTAKPVIKKVDVEKLKEEFAGKPKGKAEKKEAKAKAAETEVKAEVEETAAEETPAKETPKASKKKEDKEDKE